MKYTWILFDADDTLFDFSRSARHALSATLQSFGINPEQSHFETYEHINYQVWSAFERQEITAFELRKLRFERFLTAIGEYRDPLEMNAHYLGVIAKVHFLMEGAWDLVLELKQQGRRIGLITNGLKEVQRPRVELSGLAVHLDVIVVSDEIGVSKPHAGFFDHAFEEMGQPDKWNVLVVGDSLQSDIQGGNRYGLDTCWFNPKQHANLSTHQPTYQIGRLEELHGIL